MGTRGDFVGVSVGRPAALIPIAVENGFNTHARRLATVN